MTVSLTFTLPEESLECRAAQDGAKYKDALCEILNVLRHKEKYGNENMIQIAEVRQIIADELEVRALTLY